MQYNLHVCGEFGRKKGNTITNIKIKKEIILFKLLNSDLNYTSFLFHDDLEEICSGVYCRYIIKTTTNHVSINQLSIICLCFHSASMALCYIHNIKFHKIHP